MLIGPAKRTLEAIQTIMKYLKEKYDVHISMRDCMDVLKSLRFDVMDNYDSQTENDHMITDVTKRESEKT